MDKRRFASLSGEARKLVGNEELLSEEETAKVRASAHDTSEADPMMHDGWMAVMPRRWFEEDVAS